MWPATAMLLAVSISLCFDAEAAGTCSSDADCKLVYGSCLCEAVPVSDPRRQLPSDVDCAVNRCRVEHTKAVCTDGACTTASDAPPPRRSRRGRFRAERRSATGYGEDDSAPERAHEQEEAR